MTNARKTAVRTIVFADVVGSTALFQSLGNTEATALVTQVVSNMAPSYKAYQQWIKDTERQGQVPSGAAIRQRFGSWRSAAEEAQI